MNFDFSVFVGIAETDGSVSRVAGGRNTTGTPGSGGSGHAKDGEAGSEHKGNADDSCEVFVMMTVFLI